MLHVEKSSFFWLKRASHNSKQSFFFSMQQNFSGKWFKNNFNVPLKMAKKRANLKHSFYLACDVINAKIVIWLHFFWFIPYHLKLKSHRVKGLSNTRTLVTLMHYCSVKTLALSTNFGESISDRQDEHIPNSWGWGRIKVYCKQHCT